MKQAGDGVSYSVVITTLSSKADAQSLVRRLVADRLVACGTILENAFSIYEWQGNAEETSEVLVMLKTRHSLWDRLQSVVHELHPYDVPELLEIPVTEGSSAYLGWLAQQTTQEPE
jgi:periplasmic divalent cation tolerance protein